jgi:methionyl-tRNA formyltransferase
MGKKLQLHAARKHPAQRFEQVKGAIGTVTAIGEQSLFVAVQGGQIEVSKLRYDGGKKLPAPQLCAEVGLSLGAKLGE